MKEFEEVYNSHYIDICNYILRLSKDKFIAEDITQETFIRAYEYIITNKKVCGKSWLYKVSYNLFIDKLRRTKRNEYREGAEEAISLHNIPHEEYEKKEEKEKIQAILDLLPLEFRNVIILREYKELSYKEIGEILNLELANVKSNIFRARQRFRKIYKEMEERR